MSNYEYTIMMADEVIDTRKSDREYQYAIACMRGPKWRAAKLKELEAGLGKIGGELANPALDERQIKQLQDLAVSMSLRHVKLQGDKDDWYVVGYCGNMALATKAHAKESKFIGDCGWDRVVIQPVFKREIKKRA